MARHFTLDQAREILPEVRRSLREAVQGKQRQDETESLMQRLAQRILMLGGVTVDTNAVEQWKAVRENGIQAQKNTADRLDDAGVVVKDLEIGLVDFPTLYRGEEVYLCYRVDEDDISFWHGVSEGFAGRKMIDDTFVLHHRGD